MCILFFPDAIKEIQPLSESEEVPEKIEVPGPLSGEVVVVPRDYPFQILSILPTNKMSVASNSSETAELFAEAVAGAERQKVLLKQLAKALGAKKARAPGPPGPGSAWTAWTSQAKTLFPEEYAEHLAELPPNAKGVQPKNDPMGFAKKCRASLHVDEWNEFEAKWKAEHPKAEKPAKEPKAPKAAEPKAKAVKPKAVKAMGGAGGPPPEEEPFASSSSAASSDGELSSASKKSGLPKATPPPKPAAKAASKPKPPTKADKTAAKEAAVAAAAAAAEADPPVPFKYRGKDYLKNDKNQVWAIGEDGAVGAWHGTYDGKKMEKSDGPA